MTTVAASYLDLEFDLPNKRYVGCLACQRDPLLLSLTATVLRSDKVQPAPPALTNGKGKGKGKKAAVEDEEDLWEIELDDTVLFPEGGGQPSDTGALVPLDSTDASEAGTVRHVVRRNLDAVHLVTKPFAVGTRVVAKVDRDRRCDLMSMHTAQHVVSAAFEREDKVGLETLSWSLQPFPEPCYVELARVPTLDEIAAVQARCTDLIRDRTPVSVRMQLVSNETGVALNDKAPKDYRDEAGGERLPVQRTVIIHDLDENPCCGTHYPDLSYLGSIFISPYTTPIRGTNSRVHFVAGPRVGATLASSHGVARTAALAAGCNPADLASRVSGLVAAVADLKRREKRLREELARTVANDLWDTAAAALTTAAADEDKDAQPRVAGAVSFREDEATNSLEFLSLVSIDLTPRFVVAAAPSAAAANKYLFVLACGDTPGASDPTPGAVLILGSDPDLVSKAGKILSDQFAGKVRGGGGRGGRWQGKLTDKWAAGDRAKLDQVLHLALGV
ncbi:hypothetical protein JCM11491_006036 [Sporobolomyces phaffii]